jgi:hypothetical protein
MGRKLAVIRNCELVLDKSGYQQYKIHNFELDRFHVDGTCYTKASQFKNWLAKKLSLTSEIPVFKERFFQFDDSALKIDPPIIIDGYWQSEKYFKDIRSTLLKDFTLKKNADKENLSWLELIQERPSVSLHIRRGDYLTNQHANAFHGTLPLTYYQNAVSKIQQCENELRYFVFSDDPQWVSENLKLDGQAYYISNNMTQGYEDLRLMKNCKYNVIANSSFSWWGAWLNENPDKKVYAPDRWFKDPTVNTKDVLPQEWIITPIN